jgi:hypothetical protein
MPQSFQIPLPPSGQPALAFPERCAACGAPKQAESALRIRRLIMRGQRQVELALSYQIPHCARCARTTKAVFLVGLIPFALGFLLVGGVLFAAVAFGAISLGLDSYGQPNNANSLVLGAAAGLFGGLLGAFLCELLVRLLLLPFYGRPLLQAPLLAVQLLADADYVAGVGCSVDREARALQISLANPAIAQDFARLNPQARRL